MSEASGSVSFAAAEGISGTAAERSPPPGPGILARFANRCLTLAGASRPNDIMVGQSASRPVGQSASRPVGMKCARRPADAPQPASSTPSCSPVSSRGRSRPDPRPGRSRARLSLLPAIALLLGALGLFAAAPAQAQTAPAAPTGLNVTPGAGSLALTWTAPSGTLTGYDVHYTSALKTGSNAVADDAAVQTGAASAGWVAVDRGTEESPPTASQTISSLAAGTAYRVRVRAKNAIGNGAWVHGTGTTPAAALSVTLTASPNPVVAGQTVTLRATLSAPAPGWVYVSLSFQRGTASASRYSGASGISIGLGSTSGTATVSTFAGGTGSVGTFTASLGTIAKHSAVGAVNKGTPSSVEITILSAFSPSNLQAAPGDRKLDLTWTAPSSGTTTGYQVHYTSNQTYATNNPTAAVSPGADGTGAWKSSSRTATDTTTSHTISGLANGTTYYVRVCAVQGGSCRDFSFASGTPAAITAPAAPTGLNVTPGADSLALTWTAPSGTLTGYDVHYTSASKTGASAVADDAAVQTGPSPSAASGWVAVDRGTEESPPTASQTISSLAAGTAYRVRVRAKNSAGNGPWLHDTGTTQPAVAPSVPQNVQVTPGDKHLLLTWEAPSSWGTWPAAGYQVEHKLGAGGAWTEVSHDHLGPSEIRDPTLTSFRFAGRHGASTVTNGSAASLRIRAWTQQPGTDGSSDSHYRDSAWVTVSATPRATASRPGAVGSLAGTPGDQRIDLRWTAPSGEVTTYRVEATTSATISNDAVVGPAGSSAVSQWVDLDYDDDRVRPKHGFTVAGTNSVTNGTPYRVRVRAENSAGAGPWSHITVTPQATSNPVAQWARSSVTVRETDADKRLVLDIILSEGIPQQNGVSIALAVSQTGGDATASGTDQDWEKLSADACVSASVAAGAVFGLSCTIVIKGDDTAESNETLELTLATTTSSGTVTVGTRNVLTVTIEDDDSPPQIKFSGHTYTLAEGETKDIDVTLSRALEVSTTVTLGIKTGAVASETDDYTLSTKTLTFAAGETAQTVTVTAVADMTTEGHEEFFLLLVAASNAPYVLADPSEAEVVILDASLSPGLILGFSDLDPRPDSIDEGESKSVFAVLSEAAPTNGATVTFSIASASTATETTDFTLSSKSVTIASGDTDNDDGTVVLKALHDAVDDHGETVVINASVTVGGTTHTASETFTIVQTVPTGLGVTPGAGRLDLAWTAPAAVTADGYHVHYTSASASGQGAVADDAEASGSEPSAAWVAVTRTATDTTASQAITGLDDDTTYRVRVRTAFTSARHHSGWVYGTGATPPATTAQAPQLTGLSLSSGGSAVTLAPAFAAGTTAYTATVAHDATSVTLTATWTATGVTVDAASVESSGSQNILTARTAIASSGGALTMSLASSGGTRVGVTISAGSGNLTEYVITVTREAAPVDTTGPSAPTFVPGAGGTVTDAGTNITLTFSEAVKKDDQNADFTGHSDLSAILTLARTDASGTAIAYAASINAGKTVITIDPTDDLAGGTVYVGISNAYYDENGNAGTAASATFTVAATTPAQSSNANLSALAASTSTSAGGTFNALALTPSTFSAGTTSYTASVAYAQTHVKLTPTVADAGKATVTVRKGASGSFTAVTSGSASTAIALGVGANALTVRVTAEDSTTKDYTVTVTRGAQAPATVTLSAAPDPVQEGESVTITATLSRALSSTVTIPLTMTDDTAESADHGTLSGIRIARGQTNGTGRIATRQDDDINDETFTVAVDTGNLPSGVTAGTPASVQITIDDDDTPTVNLSYSPRTAVKAGESVTITATLSAPLTGAVTIPLTLMPDEGTTSADYGTLANIQIAAGATSGSGTLATVADADTEHESVRVMLGTLPAEVGKGPRSWVRVTIAPRSIPIVWLTAPETVNEGEAVTVTAHLTEALSAAVEIPVTASFNGGPGAAHKIPIAAGATTGTLDIATAYDDDSAHETLIVEIDTGWLVAVEPPVRIEVFSRDHPTNVVITVKDRPALTAHGGSAREGQDDAVTFTVRLSYVALDTVTVAYTTADAAGDWQGASPATAGADYTRRSGTLTFVVPETEKTVSVPIHDDAVDEGSEHFLLRLSNPQGAYVKQGHGEAHGVITNDDHLQSMWLARFGRMAASHLTDAVSDRLDADLTPGTHVTLAGQSLDLTNTDDAEALANTVTGLARAFGASEAPAAEDDPFARSRDRAAAWNDPAATAGHSMTGRELLLGSTFHLASPGGGAGPALAAWGRVAHGRFAGEHADDTGRTGVDGDVLTGTLGTDADWGRVLAGVAVSLSEGDGSFDSPGVDRGASGDIKSTMTTVSPYLRFKLSERVSAWGLVGWGTGDMTIAFDDGAMDPVHTDIGMRMGAIGARGALMEQEGPSGMDLALKADVFTVRTESDAAANSAATVTDAGRVRLALDGGRAFALSETATFRPAFEVGLRLDGGDAESGAGLELGGGVGWTDTATGFSLEAKARMLAAHADSGYEEWGMSATARLDPGAGGRGLSFSLAPTLGTPSSATDRLWDAQRPNELASGGGFDATRGLQAEAGYGLPLAGGRFTGTPNVGLGLADGGARDWRIGWRLTSAVPDDSGFELTLDALRREAAGGATPPDHGLMLRGAMRW